MLQGDTRNIPLPNIFQTLDLNQQEGILTIQFQKTERFIAIRTSGISFLTESAFSSRLLQQTLAKLKILTPGEYQNVFATATAEAPPGDLLLNRHLLFPQQITEPVREQFLEYLYEIFAWQGVHYRFEVQPIGKDRLIVDGELRPALEFPVNTVLMEVARREDEWERIREVIPSPHQIFRFVEGFGLEAPADAGAERVHEIAHLVNGERTLDDVVEEASSPPFVVFSTLRQLIAEGAIAPIPVDEKRALAERVRLHLSMDKVAGIYQSVLEDDPSDSGTRRKLLTYLERNETPAEDLLPHYRFLAVEAREKGDLVSTRDYLRKVLEFDPRDLDCLEQLTLLEVETKREKEWQQILRNYVEAVRKQRAYERGATFLLDVVETRPGEASAIHEAAHLYLLAGQPKNAATTYERAAKLYVAKKDFSRLRNVVEKLEVCDARAAGRWRKHLAGASSAAGSGKKTKIAAFLGVLVLGTVGVFGWYEWDARATYAQILDSAKRRALSGQVDAAREDLEDFRRDYPFTLVAQSMDSDLRRLEELARRSASANPVNRPKQISYEAERRISKAATLKRRGDYGGALGEYDAIDVAVLPEAVAQTVREERTFLTEYLQQSSKAFELAKEAEKAHDYARSSRLYQETLDRYPLSPVVDKILLPLLIEVMPPFATVRVGDKPMEKPPYLLHVKPGDTPLVTVEAPSFAPFSGPLDPRERWRTQIALQKQARWNRYLDAPVEAEPTLGLGHVFVGTRSGRVIALDSLDGAVKWIFPLEGLGDALGTILVRGEDILFSGTDKALYRVSARTGTQVYRLPFPDGAGFTRVPMTVPDLSGRTFVVTTAGKVMAFDVDEPKHLWSYRLGGSGLVPPQRFQNLVVSANSEGRVYALDAASGDVKWSVPLGSPVTTKPAGNNEIVLVGTQDQHVYALSTTTGDVVWEHRIDSTPGSEAILLKNRCLVLTERGHLHCFRLEDGHSLWQRQLEGSFEFPPIVKGSLILTTNQEGLVQAQLLENGTEVWTYATGSRPGCSPILKGDDLIVTTMDHRIHVITEKGWLGSGRGGQ